MWMWTRHQHPVYYIEIQRAGRKYRYHVWKIQKISVVTEYFNVIHWCQCVVFSNKNTMLVLYLHISNEHITPVFTPDFSGVRVTQSLVLCVCFVDRYLPFCLFCFDHCVVCYFSIYRFWLPLWYLQTLLLFLAYSLKCIVIWFDKSFI